MNSSKKNILVLDNLEEIRITLTKCLRDYNVYNCESAQQAMKFLLIDKINIDLFIIDIFLRKISGDEFVEILKYDYRFYDYKSIPIIITTSNLAKEIALNLITDGVTDFLIKPYKINDLIKRINRILQ